MKKLILIPSFILISFGSLFAQSFQVITSDTVMIETDPEAISEAHAQVKNNTNQPIRTLVKREILQLATEHVNYFCWGVNCYAPTTTQSPDTLLLEPASINNTFKGYIDPSGFEGISEVRYCFINATNQADQSCFKVRYLIGETASVGGGGKEPGQPVQAIASYDSYSQTIRVAVSSGTVETMNMIGQKVELNWKYDGTGMVADASSLKPGYYFLFGKGDNKLWSARVIVTR